MPPRATRARLARVRGALPIQNGLYALGYSFFLNFTERFSFFFFRMSTAEHLPSGWPFESSHYMSTFRTPQLRYCRHNVQPSSVHRKNNPHAALTDPWQYPNKVMYQHVSEVSEGPTQAFSMPHPFAILAQSRSRDCDNILLSRPIRPPSFSRSFLRNVRHFLIDFLIFIPHPAKPMLVPQALAFLGAHEKRSEKDAKLLLFTSVYCG